MSNPASSPLRRGVEQILATADHTTLVIKATKDGKLDVMSNAFVEGEAAILDGECLEMWPDGSALSSANRFSHEESGARWPRWPRCPRYIDSEVEYEAVE